MFDGNINLDSDVWCLIYLFFLFIYFLFLIFMWGVFIIFVVENMNKFLGNYKNVFIYLFLSSTPI